jgi:hypothetical protein
MVYFICIKHPTFNKWFNLVGPLESSDIANSLVSQTRIEAHKIDPSTWWMDIAVIGYECCEPHHVGSLNYLIP